MGQVFPVYPALPLKPEKSLHGFLGNESEEFAASL